MNTPFKWWANRKSKNGLRPLAKAPPHLPSGKAWWTEPPTAPPQPEHIEYVAQFMAELYARKPGHQRDAMIAYVASWMRAARRLLHEQYESDKHGDLVTTDGLILAANQLLLRTIGKAIRGGYELDERDQATIDAIRARAHKLGRERAIDGAKTAAPVHETRAIAKLRERGK